MQAPSIACPDAALVAVAIAADDFVIDTACPANPPQLPIGTDLALTSTPAAHYVAADEVT